MSRKSIKVYFEVGIDRGHTVRGIGVHTTELLKQYRKLTTYNLQLTSKQKADVVHFTHFKPFEKTTVPFLKPSGQKWILTIHDLIPLIYPTHYPPGIRGKLTYLSNLIKIKKNIDAVITISETSKKDICRLLKIDPRKVFVVYLAPKKIFKNLPSGTAGKKVIKKYDLPDKFVLYSGDVNYNKNIPNLIKACRLAKLPLVIVGKHALEIEKMDLTHPELKHLSGVDITKVTRLGFVSDEELLDLFNLATVYVQPSYYEGFGLPVLEAVACKTPLVVTKTQALVEILGTEINFVDPNDPKSIAKGIKSPNKNIKLPRRYSWEKCAKETKAVYEKI